MINYNSILESILIFLFCQSIFRLIENISGQAESALEKLKTEHVCGWLSEVMKTHYEVFISCLLPHPADYVRVGGHW